MVAPTSSELPPKLPPEPPSVSAAMQRAHARYWRFNITLIAVLMAIGFCVSFVAPLYARELAAIRFAGFSLPFYLGAQGAVLVYLALIAVYIVSMQVADRALRRAALADAPRNAQPVVPEAAR